MLNYTGLFQIVVAGFGCFAASWERLIPLFIVRLLFIYLFIYYLFNATSYNPEVLGWSSPNGPDAKFSNSTRIEN